MWRIMSSVGLNSPGGLKTWHTHVLLNSTRAVCDLHWKTGFYKEIKPHWCYRNIIIKKTLFKIFWDVKTHKGPVKCLNTLDVLHTGNYYSWHMINQNTLCCSRTSEMWVLWANTWMSHSLPQSQWPVLSFVTARATKCIYIPYSAFAWHWGAWWFLCGRCGAKKATHLHVLGADLWQ